MLNVPAMLLWMLCVLFGVFIALSVISTGMGQTPPDATPNNPVPSQLKTVSGNTIQPQSDTLTIIQEIHASEKRISDEVQNLHKEMGALKTDIAVLKTRVNTIQWGMTIIGAPILIYLITLGIQKLPKRGSKTEAIPENSQSSEDTEDRDQLSSGDEHPSYVP